MQRPWHGTRLWVNERIVSDRKALIQFAYGSRIWNGARRVGLAEKFEVPAERIGGYLVSLGCIRVETSRELDPFRPITQARQAIRPLLFRF